VFTAGDVGFEAFTVRDVGFEVFIAGDVGFQAFTVRDVGLEMFTAGETGFEAFTTKQTRRPTFFARDLFLSTFAFSRPHSTKSCVNKSGDLFGLRPFETTKFSNNSEHRVQLAFSLSTLCDGTRFHKD
jgi:hypothetical protein